MKKHLDKISKCIKSIDSIGYTDEQLYNLSLIKVDKRNKNKEIIGNPNSPIISNIPISSQAISSQAGSSQASNQIINEPTVSILVENIENTKDNKSTKIDDSKCIYCDNIYANQYSLKRHMNNFCKKKNKPVNTQVIENNIEHQTIENKTIENNIENQIIENNIDKNIENNIETQNNYISNNQTNNLNINIISLPIGFEKDWDTEHINKYLKELIVVSDNKYTSLLTKILDNKTNLNVILDKELDNGYIFSDNEYKNIEKQEIVDKSMEKLNKELNRMLGEILDSDEIFCMKSIESQKTLINDKYSEYTKNSSIQKIVQKYIIDIYDATKNVANDYLIEYKKINKEGF
jgi:hypothetical protein